MRQQHQLYLSLRSILTAQSDLQGLKQPELKRQKESAKHDRLYGNPEEKSIPIIVIDSCNFHYLQNFEITLSNLFR